MIRLYFGVLLVLIVATSAAQDLLESSQKSSESFIFSITDNEARQIHRKEKCEIDATFFHTLVARCLTDSVVADMLAAGHYLIVRGAGNELAIDYLAVQGFAVEVLNNSADLAVAVFDSLGRSIAGAQVKLRAKRLHYDEKTETYRDRKSNRRGLLEVEVEGQKAFYQLSRAYNNYLGKRIYRKVAFGSPVRYVWRPVNFVLHVPIDGVKSLVRGYPIGAIQRLSRAPVTLYKKVACWFDPWFCNDWKFTSKYSGYMVFSKPKYREGDTLKLKAFVTKTNGKPLRKAVHAYLYTTGQQVDLGVVRPYLPGGYAQEFILSDTLGLSLDRQYTIELNDRRDRRYISGYFKYEDYELGKIGLELHTADPNHYRGDTLTMDVIARDENQLTVMDGRLQVLVSTEAVLDFDQPVQVPDTLTYFEQVLDPKGQNELKIPDTIFPKANMSYTVNVVMLTADNERLRKQEELMFYENHEVYGHTFHGDSIRFYAQINGVESQGSVNLLSFDGFNQLIDDQQVSLPVSIRLNPYCAEYRLVKEGEVKNNVELQDAASSLKVQAYRTADSLFVQVKNPRKIPLVYYLYKGDREITRGRIIDLSVQRRTHGAGNYHLSVQYLWGGRSQVRNYEIPLLKNQLQVAFNSPKVISPGQEVTMEIAVTDYRGKPVSGADILAHALTKKFEASPATLPDPSIGGKTRRLINIFELGQHPTHDERVPLDYHYWNPLMALDSLAYYQFLYPDSIYQFCYAAKDSITQFAPFIVEEGIIQPVGVIYVDHVPVYFSWMTDQPYSFAIDSGFHTIRMRTPLHDYVLKDQYFEFGFKTIISINAHLVPGNVEVKEASWKYTKREVSNLSRFVMPFRYTFGGRHAYVQQEGRYFGIKPDKRPYMIGPMRTKMVGLQVLDGFDLRFPFEEGFEYELREGLMKMRSKEPEELVPELVTAKAITALDHEVWTHQQLVMDWEHELKRRRLASRKYRNPTITDDREGKLLLKYLQPDSLVVNTLLIKLDDADFLRVYPRKPAVVHALDAGDYRLIFLLADSLCSILDSVKVTLDVSTCQIVDFQASQSNKAFTDQVNAQLDSYFEYHGARIDREEEQELMRTYQQSFQYFGPGEVISGVVYDEESGESLPGVTVIVKGTTYGTVSDLEGRYSLRVPLGYNRLIFSFVGMASEERTIDERGDVFMQSDQQRLEEVVVVGYGVTKRRSLTAAVTTVSGDLAGVAPGVSVMSDDAVMVRGTSSVSSSNAPLIVIDGVVYHGDLAALGLDVENIAVYKTNDMIQLYGARAANGVIVITRNQIPADRLAQLRLPVVADEPAAPVDQRHSLRSHFSDEGFWQPRLQTDAQGKVSFTVKFPDDVTNWDAYVYVMNARKQVGLSRQAIKSYKSLSAQLSLPRFSVEGDSIWVVGKALNYRADTVQVQTSFQVNETSHSRDIALFGSHIDSLMVSPKSVDSLEVKYFLTEENGYFDGELRKIPVHPVGVEKSVGHFAALHQDTTLSWHFADSLGLVHLFAARPSAEAFRAKLNSLIDYPYGCNEQLASRLKALLLVKQLDDDLNLKKVRERTIRQLLKKLQANQNREGLWGWWNQSPTSYWVSVQVAESLQMAQSAGYEVSVDKELIRDEAAWHLSGNLDSRSIDWLYIAQCFGSNLNYAALVEDLEREIVDMQDQLRLERIRQRIGQRADMDWVLAQLTSDDRGRMHFRDTTHHRLYYKDSRVEYTVMALQLLAADSVYADETEQLQNYLLEQAIGAPLNTYLLSNSLTVLLSTLPDLGQELKSEVWINGLPVKEWPLDTVYHERKINIVKEGRLAAYIGASQTYREVNPTRDTSSFQVTAQLEGGGLRLKSGEPERIRVTVVTKSDQEYVMVEVPIPAGCSYQSKARTNPWEVHREYFKEQVAIFCRELPKGTHQFQVEVLPRFAGKYTLNPARAELMYFPAVMGHDGVGRVLIE